MSQPKVGIVILNWNGWRDTVECLESVLRLDYPDCHVVVCDNGSTDDSLAQIRAWAAGALQVKFDGPPGVLGYVQPPVAKPLALCHPAGSETAACRLALLENGANLGYAAGNNAGIRLLLQWDVDYVWVLNNDTVVTPAALRRLVERMECDPQAGICGSKLLYYWQPERIQALGGGSFNPWTTSTRHLALDERQDSAQDIAAAEQAAAYIVGASLFVSRRFLDTVGLLSEAYFLFFEEIDWAVRGRRHGFTLAIAEQSIVYHKEGGSTGSSSNPNELSPLADYYVNRSRLRFVRRYYPMLLPLVYGRFGVALLNRLRRKQKDRIPLLLKAMFNR